MKVAITRPIDSLGRIVIPKEIRDHLDVKENSKFSIWINDEGKILLRQKENACILCGNQEKLVSVQGKKLCRKCVQTIQKL